MLISIITPFYCGNSYMAGFYQMVEKAAKEFLAQGQERSVEVIIVNDSPWERVELPENESHSFRLIVIDNKKNQRDSSIPRKWAGKGRRRICSVFRPGR